MPHDFGIKVFPTDMKIAGGQDIRTSILEMKKNVSYQEVAALNFQQLNISIHEPISLNEFTRFIQPHTEKFENRLTAFIANSGLATEEIDTVFMTGGSSLVPALHGLFAQKIGENKIRGGETFTSAASGLALSTVSFF